MIVNAARQLGALAADGHPVCFVGHRPALHRSEPRPPAVLAGAGARLRVRVHRLQADPAAAEHRRRRARRDRRRCRLACPRSSPTGCRPGRIDVGFLGGAQLDKYANINSTVIGDYEHPSTRLPGAGGAPEIAASAGAVMVIMRQSKRAFVERCDFRSSVGYGDGPGDRERFGLQGGGPKWVITDLGVLEPDPVTCELTMVALHPGVTREQAVAATGWSLRFADDVPTTAPPTADELDALEDLAGGVMEPVRLHRSSPSRMVFGAGAIRQVGAEVRRPRRVAE